ncbi:MAG: ATP-grasp domain-containing protein [Proteobacteria bacterium]|nr:ATP-grasp domain-containing protein [Pseudomonadota bacterium]
MYRRILVANRGDCAVRLISACHALGAEAVLIAASDDRLTAPAALADVVVTTGMSRTAYTHQDNILAAMVQTRCEAILPGWGFLSEDPIFAQRCRLMGRHFVGPKTPHLALFGDKLATLRHLCPVLGLPLQALSCDDHHFWDLVSALPFPLMLKKRTGGGGKAVHLCHNTDALRQHLKSRLAHDYFVEPAILHARHIEFQILGDGRGQAVILGARDCTPQVHAQKWLERHVALDTSPQIDALAKRIAAHFAQMAYEGLATLECLVQDNNFFLLEVNPRLQVEHGVTEMARGIDLVQASLSVACGQVLPTCASASAEVDVVEFRLFARSPGCLERIGFGGCPWPDHPHAHDPCYRLETGYTQGERISGVYDGLIARFIVKAPPNQALHKLKAWLQDFQLTGLTHNLADLMVY